MDGKKFPPVKGADLFYALYGDLGLELIDVEKITWKVLGSERDDRALGREKKIKCRTMVHTIYPGSS